MAEAISLYRQADRLRSKAAAAEDGTLAMFRRKRLRLASDLARQLAISPQAANNRLARLWRDGWLTRERANPSRGGKQFLYFATNQFVAREDTDG